MISSVNVTKFKGFCGFGHIYCEKSLMENFIFCVVLLQLPTIQIIKLNDTTKIISKCQQKINRKYHESFDRKKFVQQKAFLLPSETYLVPHQTSKMKLLVKIIQIPFEGVIKTISNIQDECFFENSVEAVQECSQEKVF